MGVRRYEDLAVWKLADEVRQRVDVCTSVAAFERHPWLQSQLRRASQSACANIAEGFGRYTPKDFARFVRNARASVEELKSHLDQVDRLRLADESATRELRQLASRVCGAATRLVRYLASAKAP